MAYHTVLKVLYLSLNCFMLINSSVFPPGGEIVVLKYPERQHSPPFRLSHNLDACWPRSSRVRYLALQWEFSIGELLRSKNCYSFCVFNVLLTYYLLFVFGGHGCTILTIGQGRPYICVHVSLFSAEYLSQPQRSP